MATMATICSVCSSNPGKYKCPSCKSHYCSVACCKSHKGTCNIETGKDEKDTNEIDKSKTTVTNVSGQVQVSRGLDDSNVLMLSSNQLKFLENSKWLGTILKSKRLREDITMIDEASNRPKLLKRFREVNPEFDQFVRQLMTELPPRREQP